MSQTENGSLASFSDRRCVADAPANKHEDNSCKTASTVNSGMDGVAPATADGVEPVLKKGVSPLKRKKDCGYDPQNNGSLQCSEYYGDVDSDGEKKRGDHCNCIEQGAKENGSSCIQRKKIQYMQTSGPPASEQVNLRLGYPSPADVPIETLRKAMGTKMQEDDPDFFMYGVPLGFGEFREQLAKFLTKHYGYAVKADNLMASNGSAGGLDLICKMYTKPGDEIFIENPTYFLAYPTFNDYHLRPVAVDMETDGVNIEVFEELLQHHKPKFFYTVPVAHNPTGRTTSAKKREKLVELAVKHQFKIVADEVYQLLSFDEKNIPSSFPYFDSPASPCVLSLGSFSKILAPAMRLGWIHAHPSLLDPLLRCGLIQSGGVGLSQVYRHPAAGVLISVPLYKTGGTVLQCLNPIMCGLAQKAIEMGFLEEHIRHNRKALQLRCEALKRALQTYVPFGSISFEEPVGGYFLLLKLPEDVTSLELLREAETNHRVSFLAGAHCGKGYDRYIRLSFSYYSPDDIELGIKRLAVALRELRRKKQQTQQQHPSQ